MEDEFKILILEDDEERIKYFRKKLEKDGICLTFSVTVPGCIQALEQVDYDCLFLDHDLGGHTFVSSEGEEKTGWHVAKWLSENKDRKPSQIIIHSLNESGRKNMKSLLSGSIEMPFAWLMDFSFRNQ